MRLMMMMSPSVCTRQDISTYLRIGDTSSFVIRRCDQSCQTSQSSKLLMGKPSSSDCCLYQLFQSSVQLFQILVGRPFLPPALLCSVGSSWINLGSGKYAVQII